VPFSSANPLLIPQTDLTSVAEASEKFGNTEEMENPPLEAGTGGRTLVKRERDWKVP
jgi:hypothetical protein